MGSGFFPEWTWIVGFVIGAFIGSFLNVVIYRVPRAIPLWNPSHSFCPSCKAQLGFSEMVPLLSWLFQKGRCRFCASVVPVRYFLVELLNAAIWGGIWYQYFSATSDLSHGIAYLAASSTLVAIIFIDWDHYIIPDQINAFLWFIGISYNIWLFIDKDAAAWTWGTPSALAGWLVGTGALWGITFLGRVMLGRDAMGHGDIKMARGIGAVLFPSLALMSFALAIVAGAVLGVVQVILFKRQEAQESSANAAESGTSGDGDAVQEEDQEASEEEELEPESIPSLLKCGLGYVLCIDIVGQFFPKLYESWFGEPAFEPIEETEDYPIERTMIPFGPYLALGAIAAVVFQQQLLGLVNAYMRWAFPPPT
ncbi:MAG: prepilin peptidase [Fimbriimonadaceae bacterium]|nr:prepilin peptidase [Fimbriimonadaceae bacterium]